MPDFIHIHPDDNVAVALRPIAAGTVFAGITATADIPQGHKMALAPLAANDQVIKYGFSIGHATAEIAPGAWVHTHNMKTNLSSEETYT
jgi:altronate hydrolase